ncbi:MAG: pantoate--beta-alanine ligase [Candidatus Caldarchaeum sp.]
MIISSSIHELREILGRAERPRFFVPTMGYFHEGHLSLMRLACEDRERARSGVVVVSLFINPLQFNDPQDLKAYPRDEERDVRMAEEVGCDVLFVPSVEEMYPEGKSQTTVDVGEVAKRWEGEFRPGHFTGVATVVAKLFNIVHPDIAYFGKKDWQQCRVIAQMVKDLDFDVSLRFGDTIREPDGLAMSSRNVLLSDTDRATASFLYETLCNVAREFRAGRTGEEVTQGAIEALKRKGFGPIDYVAVVDENTLEPVEKWRPHTRVLAAVYLGGVRLIDNLEVP